MRKPPGMGFETWIDRQIREAADRGEFDNLPGSGKPIPGRGEADDELWWVKQYIRREGLSIETLLPTPLRLRKEVERLPETVADLHTEQAVRDVVNKLNLRIMDWLRAPSGPQVLLLPVDVADVVRQWRATRPVDLPANPRGSNDEQARRRARWWRHRARDRGLFRRRP